ncbi:hypothetical protein KFK09_028263 [Dendrobium nobile]|uniref:Uncharacterized protein n=1 Tax=Dendrobium nobile TaxID=94219 RepID=A0A8T3A2W0_DENNO|nr:hypothetical protein KFK09_028263 [Dendrobium nobile]
MSKKKGRDFNCSSTSNPYHVCADICFEKTSEMLQDVGKEPVVLEYPLQNKEMIKVQRKGETPTSLKAVKSFSSCAGNFFSTNTRVTTKERTTENSLSAKTDHPIMEKSPPNWNL